MFDANALDLSSPPSAPLQPEDFRRSGFVRSRYGVWLKKNWTDTTFHFCYRGTYGTRFSDYLAAQTLDFIFVDVGANQGLYSLIAATNPACRHALAFEPVPRTRAIFEANIFANGLAERVRVIEAAICAEEGETPMALRPGHSGAASLRSGMGLFRKSLRVTTLGPTSLKKLVDTNIPAIIKIDVEGHEAVVLRSLARAGILKNARALYYEVDKRWSRPAELENLARSQGFSNFEPGPGRIHYDVLARREDPDRATQA